jgi:cell division protein FtsW
MDDFTFSAAKPVEKYHKIDIWMLISIVILWGLGIFTVYFTSTGSKQVTEWRLVSHQLISSGIGFVFFILFAFLDMRIIKKLVPAIVILALVLCVLTFIPFFSKEINGARRWIGFGNYTFQPSELVKFAVVLFIANFFDKESEKSDLEEKPSVLPCVLVLMGFTILVGAQNDFSTCLLIFLVGFLLFVVSGQKIKWFFPLAVASLPFIFLLIVLKPYRLDRIKGFLFRNNADYHGTLNYQVNTARSAIIEGGFLGNGIGMGLEKTKNIPEIQADFIFAGWSEAMGFLGVVIYICVLAFFAWRGYRSALKNPGRFAAYGCFGCVSFIVIQSLINCMVVAGMLPTTGITLPFFSLGGSSIMVTLAMSGFIVNASSCREIPKKEIINDENEYESLISDFTE